MENEINEPQGILQIIEKYVKEKIEEGVDMAIAERHPDSTLIWECIKTALERAEVPQEKWDDIRQYVEKEMHKDGWKFELI
jgi:hypothetical protein